MANVKSSEDINKITVKPSGESVTYNVRTSNPSNKITANATRDTSVFGIKDNMSEYYAKISENWAHADVIVEGTDFSSKYYAQQSKNYAEQVGDVIGEAKSIVDGFEDLAKGYSNTFATTANTALSDINSNLDNACIEIETVRDNSVVTIEQTKADSLETLEQATEENKQEVRDVVNLIKDDLRDIVNRVGFCLFDTVVKDHVLTYEESQGLAPLGSYVYKDAIAGERYGYPDFYNKVIEEYYNSTVTPTWLKNNITSVGGSFTDNYIFNGASGAYMKLPDTAPLNTADSWEFKTKYTHNGGGTYPCILGTSDSTHYHNVHYIIADGILKVYLSSNGSSWNIASALATTFTPVTGTTYYLKIGFTGSTYYVDYNTDGSDVYTNCFELGSTVKVYSSNPLMLMNEGYNLTTYHNAGSMDLSKTSLIIDGVVWWDGADFYNLYKNDNGHIFYNISEKYIIDDVFATTGSAWLYGIDQENECIFMPRDNSKIHGKLIESFSEGSSWYRIYSDGWCEQGGYVYISNNGQQVNLLLSYKNTQYVMTTTGLHSPNGNIVCHTRTVSGFQCYTGDDSSFNAGGINWVAYGYIDIINPIELEKQTYICVGNQVADTSWVDTVTQVQEGVKDIEDVRKSSIKEIEQTTTSCIQDVEIRGAELRSKMALSMFDTILKDHVLTYEESKGLALQGTYVYKNAVAGSRYGYPSFYNKCLKEFQNATNEQIYLKSNVTKVGSVVDNQGILKGFSTANYATLPKSFNSVDNWECNYKLSFSAVNATQYAINVGSSGSYACLFGINATGKFVLWCSSNNTSWNIADGKAGTYTVTANQYYYVRYGFNGEEYYLEYSLTGEEESYIRDITIASTAKLSMPTGAPNIGYGWSSTPANAMTVDLNESHIDINGERYWTGVETAIKNPNGHIFYNISQKDSVDELFESTGVAWLYGIDTDNERVFLPRNNYFEQATGNILEAGQNVKAGLPNITAECDAYENGWGNSIAIRNTQGAFYTTSTRNCINRREAGASACGIGFDASRSNPIYGGSDTVQPASVKKLLYICVGDTVVTSSITDVVDVTTTRNDTTPLFTGMYFDFTPNNVSWLKAGQQSNSGGIYKTCYNELVNVLNGETKYGNLKVVDTSKMVSDTDYSLYWKVNQRNQTFIAPSAYGLTVDLQGTRRVLIDKKEPTDTDSTWYNLYSDGWLEQGGQVISAGNGVVITQGFLKPYLKLPNVFINFAFTGEGTAYYQYLVARNVTNTQFQFVGNVSSTQCTMWQAFGYTEIPSVDDYTENVNLYFKVANAVQNLELLNAGEVLEAVNNISAKVDAIPHIVETYQSGTSWYRVYSDGWCEQGGRCTASSQTVSFLKPFISTNYTVTGGLIPGNPSATYEHLNIGSLTNASFYYTAYDNYQLMWQANGYIA